MSGKKKQRLDAAILERHPHLSRNQIQSFIMQGQVKVNDQVVTKPGHQVNHDADILLALEEPKYVSRAGFKLEAALEHFKVDVTDLIALDAGISTGGFTDCLLKNGIKRVYGVDVGYGQVHEKIRNDKRLILLEKTNLRHLEQLPELVDLVTLDLSFISILKVMPAIVNLIKPTAKLITLIKPQFEAERNDIRKGGLVLDDAVHERVIEKIRTGMTDFGCTMVGVIESPVRGAASGNKEFLAFFEFHEE